MKNIKNNVQCHSIRPHVMLCKKEKNHYKSTFLVFLTLIHWIIFPPIHLSNYHISYFCYDKYIFNLLTLFSVRYNFPKHTNHTWKKQEKNLHYIRKNTRVLCFVFFLTFPKPNTHLNCTAINNWFHFQNKMRFGRVYY